MADGKAPDKVPVKVTVKDANGKEVASTTIDAPGSHTFDDMSAGSCVVSYKLPSEYDKITDRYYHFSHKTSFTIRINKGDVRLAKPPAPKPPPFPIEAVIFGVLIGLPLLGNAALLGNLSPSSQTGWGQPSQAQPSSRTVGSNPSQPLSPQLETQLRQCLRANIERLAGVPSLADLVESIVDVDLNWNPEFQSQLLLWYDQVTVLNTLEDCDPALVQSLLAADRQQREQSSGQISMMVTGEAVNVRSGASLNSEIIAQLSYGTMVQLDVQVANPSPEVSTLATIGNTD